MEAGILCRQSMQITTTELQPVHGFPYEGFFCSLKPNEKHNVGRKNVHSSDRPGMSILRILEQPALPLCDLQVHRDVNLDYIKMSLL